MVRETHILTETLTLHIKTLRISIHVFTTIEAFTSHLKEGLSSYHAYPTFCYLEFKGLIYNLHVSTS
jgi:hypothetical protein